MFRIVKKLLVVLLLAIIFISNCVNLVQAAFEITDAYIEKIGDCAYHLKYYKEEKGMYTYSTCAVVGYHKDGNFYPAYCLNRDLHGVGAVESYTVDVDSLLDNNEVWRAVTNGYPYKTASQMGLANDFDAFAVTKFAIYCLIGQADVDLYTADEEDYEGQAMLSALKRLVDIGKNGTEKFSENLKISKVGDFKEDGNYYSAEYKVTANSTISNYNITKVTGLANGDLVTDETGNVKTNFDSGEKFKVKILKENLNSNKDINIEVEGKLKSHPIFYGKTRISGTQNYLLTATSYKNTTAQTNLKLKLNNGKIAIKKLDEETKESLEGVEFELYNSKNELVNKATTDKNGKAEFRDLFQGKYYLKEIKTKEEYILEENSNFEINVNYNKVSSIEIENKHKKGNLEVYKTDKDNHNIAIGNVGFELYDEEKKLIGTYYTDANGKIEVKDLRTGNYLLKEISTNKWYNLAEDKTLTIKWNETKKEQVEDELKKGQIKVIKVDKDNSQTKIPNVEFEVLDEAGNVLEKIVTDENGEALTKKYPLRDYSKIRLHETKTGENYKLNDEIKEIILEENKIKDVTFENEKKKGQIRVIKVDKDNQETKLANVKFNVLDESGKIVDTIITNEQGEATTKALPIDQKYLLQEVETKENYVLSEETKTLTLEEDKIKDITFENEKKKGKIKVIKVDKENNEIKLENVEFDVLDVDGNIIEKIKTNKEGIATTKRLPIDKKYILKERKTDERYVLSEETKTITLEQDKISDIVFENEKIKGKIKIIKRTEEKSEISGLEKGSPLENVKFEVYDEAGKVVDTITTNNEGIAITKDLEKGKYKVKEIETNKWYILDENSYDVEITTNKQILTLNINNKPGKPDEEIEKTGPEKAQANEEIKYNINVKNTGNVPLDNFIWEDEIPVDYIRVNKIKLGTYNQEQTYNLYYKSNLTKEYVLLYEDINTTKEEEIDLSKELVDGEYITGLKLEFGTVNVGFSSNSETNIFGKINPNVKNLDEFENKVTLTGDYKGHKLTKESKWKTSIYKILPLTGM